MSTAFMGELMRGAEEPMLVMWVAKQLNAPCSSDAFTKLFPRCTASVMVARITHIVLRSTVE